MATTIAWIVALAIHGSRVSAQPALTAVKAVAPPTIDGEIGDQEWQGAAIARDFIQYEPGRGDRSPFSTEALVLYDDRTLYVAFRAPDPDTPVAQLTQRDADLFSDDAVIVILDSFYDRQSAYYFMTNPLGAQSDGRVADDGRTVDGNWDAPWRSAARRSDAGWSAEIAVPLGAIKYVAGSDRRWGLNLGRVRRRSLEVAFWAGPLDAPTGDHATYTSGASSATVDGPTSRPRWPRVASAASTKGRHRSMPRCYLRAPFGICYPARTDLSKTSVAIFDRAKDDITASSRGTFLDPQNRQATAQLLDRYGIALISGRIQRSSSEPSEQRPPGRQRRLQAISRRA